MSVDSHRAFRQLQRWLHIDDQGRSYRQPPVVRPEDCEVVGTIVYDHEMCQIVYTPGGFPKKEDSGG